MREALGGLLEVDRTEHAIVGEVYAAGRKASHRARHFGLVVDDKEGVRAALASAGVEVQRSGSLDFDDPWGNHVQVVDYRDIQFTKAPSVLTAMGLDSLEKTEAARREIRDRGL